MRFSKSSISISNFFFCSARAPIFSWLSSIFLEFSKASESLINLDQKGSLVKLFTSSVCSSVFSSLLNKIILFFNSTISSPLDLISCSRASFWDWNWFVIKSICSLLSLGFKMPYCPNISVSLIASLSLSVLFWKSSKNFSHFISSTLFTPRLRPPQNLHLSSLSLSLYISVTRLTVESNLEKSNPDPPAS